VDKHQQSCVDQDNLYETKQGSVYLSIATSGKLTSNRF